MNKDANLKKMTLSLSIIALISSASLGFVNNLTKGPKAAAEAIKLNQAVSKVLPEFDNNPIAESYKIPSPDGGDSIICYPAIKGGNSTGCAIETWTMNGFSGLIRLMVGFDNEGKIIDISVLEQKETPGLGTKILTAQFKDQFKGMTPGTEAFGLHHDGGEIDAITAATISSKAFIDAIMRGNNAFLNIDGNSGATNTDSDNK